MKDWLQDFLGITHLRINMARDFTHVEVQGRQLEQRLGEIEDMLREEKLSTQRTQKALQSLEAHMDGFATAMSERLPILEENDIEKDTGGDEIAVTDDMHIPIVSGMKVRFETEGVETDIHID